MRVFFTGGSGKAGRHAIAHLADQGHKVTNIDIVPHRHPGVPLMMVELTDGHLVLIALACPASGD